MARNTGILKIQGTLENLTFYKTQDGHLVKTKGGVSGDKIANDANFARTRENGAEFGMAAGAGKLLRDTLRPLMQSVADNRVVSRVTQLMTQVKNFDTSNDRGERQVSVGFEVDAGKNVFKGVDLNLNAPLTSVFYKSILVDTSTGTVTLSGFTPKSDIYAPKGCTDLTIQTGWARVDFAGGVGDIVLSTVQSLPYDNNLQNMAPIMPNGTPQTTTGIFFNVILISFFQTINGKPYPLNNGFHNTLNILNVW